MTDRSVAGRRFNVRSFAAGLAFVVIAGVGMPAAGAAPAWRTRAHEMVQSHAEGTFWGAHATGTTKRDPAKVRLRVQWTARDDEDATLDIGWSIDCYSRSRDSRWSREDREGRVRLSSGDKLARTYRAQLHICSADVSVQPFETMPAGTLKVWVEEYR